MSDTEITALSDPVIEQAVIIINNKVEQTVYEGSVEIGEYVLEHFFNNAMRSLGAIEAVADSLSKLARGLSGERLSGEESAGEGGDADGPGDDGGKSDGAGDGSKSDGVESDGGEPDGGEPDGEFSGDIEPGSEGDF